MCPVAQAGIHCCAQQTASNALTGLRASHWSPKRLSKHGEFLPKLERRQGSYPSRQPQRAKRRTLWVPVACLEQRLPMLVENVHGRHGVRQFESDEHDTGDFTPARMPLHCLIFIFTLYARCIDKMVHGSWNIASLYPRLRICQPVTESRLPTATQHTALTVCLLLRCVKLGIRSCTVNSRIDHNMKESKSEDRDQMRKKL